MVDVFFGLIREQTGVGRDWTRLDADVARTQPAKPKQILVGLGKAARGVSIGSTQPKMQSIEDEKILTRLSYERVRPQQKACGVWLGLGIHCPDPGHVEHENGPRPRAGQVLLGRP